jgi:hypothetical protein
MFNFIKSLFTKKVEPMITLSDYLTASGEYPEREKSPELTPELLANAEKLLKAINSLLAELNIKQAKVSSGFRPSVVNAGIGNAAKKSNHLRCLAIDLLDDNSSGLDILMLKNLPLLKKYGIYLEDPRYTKRWCHLQIVVPASGNRIFIPSSEPPSVVVSGFDGSFDKSNN